MLIDWFTVAAQIFNFLVLVYLLKRFLYGPIIRAMDERERKIASRMEEAEKKEQEAEREAQVYLQKNAEFDGKRDEMLSRAKEEAEARRKELLGEVRNQVETIQNNWSDAIQREKEAFLQDLRQRTAKHVYAIARRALKDLANAELEERMVQVVVERIQNMNENEKKALNEALRDSGHMIDIHSSFEIPKDSAKRIRQALKGQIPDLEDARFEISSDAICGIELRAQDRKIAWSLEDYLQTLEESLIEAFEGEVIVQASEEVPTKEEGTPKQAEDEKEPPVPQGVEKRHGKK